MVVGVVGVGRAEQILDRRVVLGLLICIANQQTNRATGSYAFKHPGQDLDLIGLLTLGGVAAGTGLAAIQITLQVFARQRQARRAAINNGDQRRAVAFAGRGNGEEGTERVSRHTKNLS